MSLEIYDISIEHLELRFEEIARYTAGGGIKTDGGYISIRLKDGTALALSEGMLESLSYTKTEIDTAIGLKASKLGIILEKVNDLQYRLMVDGVQQGTIDIPKDRFIQSASYDPATHKLTLVFITSSGEESVDIDLSGLVDAYTAGSGLELSAGQFSVKVKTGSKLSATAEGMDVDLSEYVVKIEGKGLSTEDYTAAEKSKLEALPTRAELTAEEALKISASDIADNLTTDDAAKVLSAKQGKALKDAQDAHAEDISNPHEVTKAQVGLGNVDNTADMEKPVSTAQQTALDGKEPADATILKKADVVNDLSSGGIDVPLSAEQGKALKDAVDAIIQGQFKVISTWEEARLLISQGYAPAVFPSWTEFNIISTVYSSGIDFVSVNPKSTYLELLMKHVIYNRQFDAPELLWANTTGAELPAGTYHFTMTQGKYGGGTEQDGTYQFTSTAAIPAGGGFRHSAIGFYQSVEYTKAQITAGKFTLYNASYTAIESNITCTEGTGGTALGTCSRLWADTVNTVGQFNCTERNAYGSGNYAESAIRQWINSALGAGLWWVAQTVFDMPPSYVNIAGFLNGLDADFVSAVAVSDVVCRYNTIFETGGSQSNANTYTLHDRFYLASREQVGYGSEGPVCGAVWEAFDGASQVDRIKYDISDGITARYWWPRAPNPSYGNSVRVVNTSGALDRNAAYGGLGSVVACTIR